MRAEEACEMHITDRKDNDLLVKHIRTTSVLNKSLVDHSRIKELARVVDSSPKLMLKVLSSGSLKGQVFKINAQGLENSQRAANDGFVYFGCKKSKSKLGNGGKGAIVNDIIIPSRDKETERRHRGRHL